MKSRFPKVRLHENGSTFSSLFRSMRTTNQSNMSHTKTVGILRDDSKATLLVADSGELGVYGRSELSHLMESIE